MDGHDTEQLNQSVVEDLRAASVLPTRAALSAMDWLSGEKKRRRRKEEEEEKERRTAQAEESALSYARLQNHREMGEGRKLSIAYPYLRDLQYCLRVGRPMLKYRYALKISRFYFEKE